MLFRLIFSFAIIFFSASLNSEEQSVHTYKKYNLNFRLPSYWRWKKENPDKKDGLIISARSPDKKYALKIWYESAKISTPHKILQKFLRKKIFVMETEMKEADSEFPHLRAMDGFLVRIREKEVLTGYAFSMSEGNFVFVGVLMGKEKARPPMMNEILNGFEPILNREDYCCTLCLEKSEHRNLQQFCSDFIENTACDTFFKNSRYKIRDCRL